MHGKEIILDPEELIDRQDHASFGCFIDGLGILHHFTQEMFEITEQSIDVNIIDIDRSRASLIGMHLTDLREILQESIVPIALCHHTL